MTEPRTLLPDVGMTAALRTSLRRALSVHHKYPAWRSENGQKPASRMTRDDWIRAALACGIDVHEHVERTGGSAKARRSPKSVSDIHAKRTAALEYVMNAGLIFCDGKWLEAPKWD